MRKYFLLLVLLLISCSTLSPTPDTFPPLMEPKIEPHSAPITQQKMKDASSFQLTLMTRVTAGDVDGIARMVKYPIPVNIGTPKFIESTEEFAFFYDEVFNDRVIKALSDTSEINLTLTPEGIRIGQGEIWFNLYCLDTTCNETQFFITRINN